MAFTRPVCTGFWMDTKVFYSLDVIEKYFFLYLLTNEHTRQLGIYRLLKQQIVFETGLELEIVEEKLKKFQDEYEMIKYSAETAEVVVLNFLKYSILSGGKPILGRVENDLKDIQNRKLVEVLYERMQNFNDSREVFKEILNRVRDYIETSVAIDTTVYEDEQPF